MAIGDAAIAAGLAYFPATQDLRKGYENDNQRGDEIAQAAAAVAKTIARDVASNYGLYLPTPTALTRYRTRRTETVAGTRQLHVAFLGDSNEFGAAGSGTSSPKYLSNYPGKVDQMLTRSYGDAGSGIVICDWNVRGNPAWDTRWNLVGTIANQGFGFHGAGCWKVSALAGTYVEFTAYCEEFVIYNLLASGGVNKATVDGGAVKTFRNYNGGGTVTNEREGGYHAGQIVTRIPAGAAGVHTLRITPDTTNAANNIFLVGVEARVGTLGRIRVTNASISGKSASSLLAGSPGDDVSGLTGLTLVDMLKADLLVVGLNVNDWLAGRTLNQLKTDLITILARQTASGPSGYGSQHAAGDVLLVIKPTPNLDELAPASGGVSWDQMREMMYTLADEYSIALLDLGDLWGTFANGNSYGMYGDGIHANDGGSRDIASRVERALMVGV